MVVRRGKCQTKALDERRGMEKRRVDHDLDEETDEAEVVKGFFACYLLCSLSPRHKGHTYIGFTVNPRRRIKQHNGEKRCGAWRTKRGRPWEMVLCIYGFPSNISALQFEWAWQHPTESLAVRKAASSFKSLSGLANKIKLAYTMLTLPSWENLNLTVNFLSSKYTKNIAGCPKLPNQMKFSISAMDELPCYAELALHGSIDDLEEEREEKEEEEEEEEVVNQMGYITSNNSSPNSTEEYYENLIDSSRKLLSLSEFNEDHWQSAKRAVELRSASSPGYCSEDCGIEWARRKSSPRRSDNDEAFDLLKSPIVDVINLCTPTSGNVRSKTKRALFDSAVIDLTDSPMVIQL